VLDEAIKWWRKQLDAIEAQLRQRCRADRPTSADCAICSDALLPPSPPAEKANARQDQAWKSSTCDGTGHGGHEGTPDVLACA